MTMGATSALSALLLIPLLLLHFAAVVHAIGINYDMLNNNLSPQATFLKTRTTIHHVKIYKVNLQILQAFANSGIPVTVTAANTNIAIVMKIDSTRQWVVTHIKSLPPQTKINYRLVIYEYSYA
ncbi:Glucan endo-1,3-beta-glucosidase 10 [Spatholobus suberectus]|nr:Glucan endo-1,3-beta-glucosidase 10 [Spatholobus suberectus]